MKVDSDNHLYPGLFIHLVLAGDIRADSDGASLSQRGRDEVFVLANLEVSGAVVPLNKKTTTTKGFFFLLYFG